MKEVDIIDQNELKPYSLEALADGFENLDEEAKIDRIKGFLLYRASRHDSYLESPQTYHDRLNSEDTRHIIKDVLSAFPDKEDLVNLLKKDDYSFENIILGREFHMDDTEAEAESRIYDFYGKHEELKKIRDGKVLQRVFFENTPVANVQFECRNRIAGMTEGSGIFTVDEKNAEKAVDLILLDSLGSRIASKDGGVLGVTQDGKTQSLSDTNRKLASMKNKLLTDSTFRALLRDGIKSDRFVAEYKAYKKAITASDTKYDLDRPADTKKENDPVRLSDEQKELFNDLEKQIVAANKGKERKGLNADMVRALKSVNEKAKNNTLTFGDISKLKTAAATYYTNRKGVFFGPRTDPGKDRLEIAGKLFDETRHVIDNVYSEERIAQIAQERRQFEENRKQSPEYQKIRLETMMKVTEGLRKEDMAKMGLSEEEIVKINEMRAAQKEKDAKKKQEDVKENNKDNKGTDLNQSKSSGRNSVMSH